MTSLFYIATYIVQTENWAHYMTTNTNMYCVYSTEYIVVCALYDELCVPHKYLSQFNTPHVRLNIQEQSVML